MSTPSPSASSVALSLSGPRRPRTGSFVSVSSRRSQLLDKESITQALDQIHVTASRSNTLTTFDDFGPPPTSSANDGNNAGGPAEIIQGGIGGLYNRLRASVSGPKDSVPPSPSTQIRESPKPRPDQSLSSGPSAKANSADGNNVPPSSKASERPQRLPQDGVSDLLTAMTTTTSGPDATPIGAQTGTTAFQAPSNASSADVKTSESRGNAANVGKPESEQRQDGSPALRRKSASNFLVDSSNPDSGSRSPGIASHRTWIDNLRDDVEGGSTSFGLQRDSANTSRQHSRSRPSAIAEHPSDVSEVDSLGDGQDLDDNEVLLATGTESRAASRESSFHGAGLQPLHLPPFDRRSSQTQSKADADPTKTSDTTPKGDVSNATASKNPDSLSPPVGSRPVLQVSQSHLPGYRPSRASSSDGGLSTANATPSVAHFPSRSSEAQRQPTLPPKHQDEGLPGNMFSQMGRRLLSRDFWMKDENAKDCFYCGEAFSTFRRKHHCRTCGQIFDAKCTSLVSGKLFGQSGNIRVCKPCEAIVHGKDDDSSVYSDDDDDNRSIYSHKYFGDKQSPTMGEGHHKVKPLDRDHTKIGAPSMGIPVSRRVGENKRRSAIIEFESQPPLTRPSSSRSLRSLSGRPRSAGHRRTQSRSQHVRTFRSINDAPFHRADLEGHTARNMLPAFHNDSIIDPDLAPFMSDEGSSDDEQASIFSTLDEDAQRPVEGDRGGFGSLLSAVKKGRSRTGERSIADQSDIAGSPGRHFGRNSRVRNLSAGSAHQPTNSPHRTKSNSLLRTLGGVAFGNNTGVSRGNSLSGPPAHGTRIFRSASMRGADIPVVELNQISLQHVRRLLKQMLQDSGVPHCVSWEKALLPILLRCTDEVTPNVRHNDHSDIRQYIKLKKIAGAKPRDTSYISGVVFTKNVALKSMPRSIPNPRIVIVTFPIEYARHNQTFMSLDPVIAQEREYLRNLVKRIAALEPQVLLVQKNVAGLALRFLEQANITVVSNVKLSVLDAVARCTRSRIISSVDKLAINPAQLGSCESFDVRTYRFEGRKKTYVYLSGCQSELGCTIVLRGADGESLRKMKRLTEFMCYAVYNLKLETCLMRDEMVHIPKSVEECGEAQSQDLRSLIANTNSANKARSSIPAQPETEPENSAESTSAPAADDKEVKDSIAADDPKLMEDLPIPSYYSDLADKHKTKILSASPFVKFKQPYLLEQAREQERRLAYLKRLRDRYVTDEADGDDEKNENKFELIQPEMVHTVVETASKPVKDFLYAVHDAEYDKAMHNYNTQRRQWEGFLSGNTDLFDPMSRQKIAFLHSLVNSVKSTPCEGPEVMALGFYNEHDLDDELSRDVTLGQYVEDLCHTAYNVCGTSGCDQRLLDHHRQYVHGDGQMSVIMQKLAPRLRGLEHTILMWSRCRICDAETPSIPMTDNTWKYSFGKYLELTFWSSNLHPMAGNCSHDIHKDHVRYFGFNNLAIRVQYDPIQLYDIIVPRPTITWKVDKDLRLKNELFQKIEARLDKFMESVRVRINGIRVESLLPEKHDAGRVEIKRLLERADEEHSWMTGKLQEKYMCSRYYEIIPLNRAVRAIHEKAIAWDETFAEFERTFFPSEKDIRRLAALQLKKIFLDRDESVSSINSIEESNEEVEDEKNMGTTPTQSSVLAEKPSTMSPEMAHSMMENIVKEESSGSHNDETPSAPAARPNPPPKQDLLKVDEPLHILEREDVRHLDLALPSELASPSRSRASSQVETPSTADSIKQPAPGHSAKPSVDSSASSHSKSSSADISQESKIPRLLETPRRDVKTRPSFSRTQSQPGDVKDMANSSNVTMSDSSAGGSKPSLAESAKALEKRITDRMGALKPSRSSGHSFIPRSVSNKKFNTRVTQMAKHFEQLSREFERERLKERRQLAERGRYARAFPLASSKPIVNVYRGAQAAIQSRNTEENLQEPSPPRASVDTSTLTDSSLLGTATSTTTSDSPVESRTTVDSSVKTADDDVGATPSHHTSDFETEISDAEHMPLDDIEIPDLPDEIDQNLLAPTESQLDLNLELPKHERNSLMKMLSSFWSERSASGWAPLEYPLASMEHVWQDSDVIVREDEPSSIIALALLCPDYQKKLHNFRSTSRPANTPATESNILFSTEDNKDASIERNLLHPSATNIKYVFQHESVRAQCKIFYAESFDALRRKCGVADRFVESLSRCVKWDSKGGKTKSVFLKTLDQRFVLKSLSPIEVNAFFRFAPNYFAFTRENLFKGLPSVIAKMFGLFQVVIKNPATGRDFDFYMLVMENLWYHGEPSRRFDLKGSMRNRKIQSTGEEDEVLLDENLVDIIFEKPIFVREHTKRVLKISVFNDTLFLSKQNVMDYSLIAGFNDTRSEIIVGIIDCIRTYTWDKKLESWIKDRGKNKPTITSPRDYRNRFRIAMGTYILLAPDCWQQFRGPGTLTGTASSSTTAVSGPPMQQLQGKLDWRGPSQEGRSEQKGNDAKGEAGDTARPQAIARVPTASEQAVPGPQPAKQSQNQGQSGLLAPDTARSQERPSMVSEGEEEVRRASIAANVKD